MLEHFKNHQYDFGSLSQDAQRLLCASSEDAIDAVHAESVYDVLREPERHELGNSKSRALNRRSAWC